MKEMSSSGGLEIGISCLTGPHFGTGGQKHTHTHLVCSPRVCGVRGDSSSVRTCITDQKATKMIDVGSNVCVTGNLGLLLDVVDIDPFKISVALEGKPSSFDDCITKQGLLPLSLSDGTTYYQTCFYCTNMVEIIISPSAILASSDIFVQWTQEGFRDPTIPGSIRFSSHNGLFNMCFQLECCHSLYYCSTDVYTVDHDPVHVCRLRATMVTPLPNALPHHPKAKFIPVSRARQLESEVWALRFGSPGENQLDVFLQHVIGTPPVFEYHPFHSIDFKEQAYICKQAAQHTAEQIPQCGVELFMDFSFIRSSTEDYRHPKKTDWVILSYDGHSAYLLIIDSVSRYVWCFLTKTRDPLLAILHAFMSKYGAGTGLIRTNQGGKLAQSKAFRNTMLQDFGYVVEPTGVDGPSQNGGAKIYNNTLAVKVCTLLDGSGLPAEFWSAALLHTVYLHNRLVHSMTNKTPFKGWHGHKPNVTHLKTFRSRVCVK
jgi:hypothetical protein